MSTGRNFERGVLEDPRQDLTRAKEGAVTVEKWDRTQDFEAGMDPTSVEVFEDAEEAEDELAD